MNNLMDNLPENLQNKIIEMKKEIEQAEKAKKFGDYINGREEHNNRMHEMNFKYKNVIMPFGKYKGSLSVGSINLNAFQKLMKASQHTPPLLPTF